ncbi:hypothetical protein GOB93_14105 [Acetobacter musti]|uniref:Uncharacterized protein n=1 Tax=Acetobacter musti TaxID=864732 RepID=A0ABX0JRG7_9PROT|nr:hypothetical protein [Acetobacter musti]NHN85766.1 hypothetical protein [Acetobacter musti]
MSGKRTREEQVRELRGELIWGHGGISSLPVAEAHITEAEQRGRELERAERAKDTERLDWLARQFKTGMVYMNGDCIFAPNHRVNALKGRNFNDAIDAAMKEIGDA